MGVPQNGWFTMGNPDVKWVVWGYPYLWKPKPYNLKNRAENAIRSMCVWLIVVATGNRANPQKCHGLGFLIVPSKMPNDVAIH